MDSLITAAARALAAGQPLEALKRVALRNDPSALALRGIAMAQLGDLPRARDLLRGAARAFGPTETAARARCHLAEAEIALVSRDLAATTTLAVTSETLRQHGELPNAAHAAYLDARRLLLIGRLDQAENTLDSIDTAALPATSRPGFWLVRAGIAMRRIQATRARVALTQAGITANATNIPALIAEVASATRTFDAPAARLGAMPVSLTRIETLIATNTLIIDACRATIRAGPTIIPLTGRPVLFALARTLAEAWPQDALRTSLITRAFKGREADESHRARLRVEIGRLRKILKPLATLTATPAGFRLHPTQAPAVAVLIPPEDTGHDHILALLSDGEAWSSSALALALGVSARSIQRALETLTAAGKVEATGKGRACRWMAAMVPGFPTSMLLSAPAGQG
jgi:HTH domain